MFSTKALTIQRDFQNLCLVPWSERETFSRLPRARPKQETLSQIHLQWWCVSVGRLLGLLEKFGVKRSWKTVHDWVHKAGIQPGTDVIPDHVVIDETVIQINGQQFWLYAAGDPATTGSWLQAFIVWWNSLN